MLFNPTHKQLQGKKRSDRETPIDSMALISAGVSWSLLVLLSGLHLSRMLPAFLVSLDFAVSLPQPEGDSEFVRRLQAADSRLQMLSKLVLRRRAFSGASVDAGRLTTALHSSCIGKALSLGNRAGGAGRAEPRTRVHHTGGCGGWPCVLFCWGGRCSAPRRAAALTPGRKGQPGRLKCTSGVKLREGAAP